MSFNDLPTELMEAIFRTHVYIHLGPRKSLLLTCRRWHAVATNFSALWRNITWCTKDKVSPITVQCRSLTSLALTIKRTGQATFELTLGHWYYLPSYEQIENFVACVDPGWLSRCRRLTITHLNKWMYDGKIHLLERIFLNGTFDALEGFAWKHPSSPAIKLNLDTFMHRFDISAPLLRELILEFIPRFPVHFPTLLGRIKKLKHTQRISGPTSWGEVPNVEHLDVTHQPGLFVNLVAPQLKSLCLERLFPPNSLPPMGTLQKLTRLVLRFFSTGEYQNYTSLSLPSLKYLGTQFDGYTTFRGEIDADKLEELAVVDLSTGGPHVISLGVNTTPRTVHLYLSIFNGFEVGLQPTSVWEKMEKLHLTVFDGTEYMPSTVSRALYTADFAPLLQCFTVRYAATIERGVPSQAQRQRRIQGLNDVMRNRTLAGVGRPKRLEVGWFPGYLGGYMLGQDSERWWVTEWTDCS